MNIIENCKAYPENKPFPKELGKLVNYIRTLSEIEAARIMGLALPTEEKIKQAFSSGFQIGVEHQIACNQEYIRNGGNREDSKN